MRPRQEVRQAISSAAEGLVKEGKSGGTFRELAQRACVGYEAARTTVKNMYVAGELEPAGEVRVPGSRLPMVLYALKRSSNWVTDPIGLGDALALWNRSRGGLFTPIDFPALAQALLDRAHTLVPQWYPQGYEKHGRWYIGDLDGSPGKSCNINLNTGTWIDNGTDEKGGDLLSLYAAMRGLSMLEAARELMAELGLSREAEKPRAVQTSGRPSSRPEPPPMDNEGPVRRKSMWRPVVPVPAMAPAPDFKHFHHGPADNHWEYRFDGQLYGYVCRFDKPPSEKRPNGGKEIVPLTWCIDESDGNGSQRWHWKQWDDPRPLYVPATILAEDSRLTPVVLVEGEKCAKAGFELLPQEFDFVSWPGGGKAWSFANWSWLRGRTVYLWPDCDAQRERLSKVEKEAGVDRSTKPIMPESKQPGMQTMVAIGSLLVAEYGCTVLMCPVPKPGAVSEGWDIADAIASGWDAETVRGFIRGAHVFTPPSDEARAKAATPPPSAGAGGEPEKDAWRVKLLQTGTGTIKPVRENAVLALDGMPGLPGVAEAAGVIAYNEFTNDIVKLKAAPWGTPAGTWEEVDELLVGEWLVREHWLPSMPRGTLEEAIRMVAYRHRFHPVRSWLSSLKWDGVRRLPTWIRRACLEDEGEWDDNDPLQQYLARVGSWFMTGMCARVMEPGFKFDYMLILEGTQGLRKSTLLRTLAGDWFADTGLVLGDKDSYQQLQGRWLYEFGELDSFGKAEVTKIKSFIASSSDYFRASFDRRARDYPRQVVFGGTTNEDHYLTDPTGNRRFWPVRVTRQIDIDWVIENRDQLFAEAMVRYTKRGRCFPTVEEERELFAPQQKAREVESAIKVSLYRHLYEEPDGLTKKEITIVAALASIGIGLEKLGPGKWHEKQAGAALRSLGWEEGRASKAAEDGKRPRVFHRPKVKPVARIQEPQTSTGQTQGHELCEDEDTIPF